MKAFVVHTQVVKPPQSSLWYSPDTSDSETKGTWIAVKDGFISRNSSWGIDYDLLLTGLLVEWSNEDE